MIVNEAGIPAVARESPSPFTIDELPQVRAGKTYAENGLPNKCEEEANKLIEGIVVETPLEYLHLKSTEALPLKSL
jgi:hypothetical protein